jgi:AraC-like DNA-binding protein
MHAQAPHTFLRPFKAATGETPVAYLQRLRTEAAKPMPESDRMTIGEVGLAVDYDDAAFFVTSSNAMPALREARIATAPAARQGRGKSRWRRRAMPRGAKPRCLATRFNCRDPS